MMKNLRVFNIPKDVFNKDPSLMAVVNTMNKQNALLGNKDHRFVHDK